MPADRLEKLAGLLGMDTDELQGIRNPKGFSGTPHGRPPKHQAIDFSEPRPWVWIEDESLHYSNIEELQRRGFEDRLIQCNTSRRPHGLLRVERELIDLGWSGG